MKKKKNFFVQNSLTCTWSQIQRTLNFISKRVDFGAKFNAISSFFNDSLNSSHEYEWFFKYLHVVARFVHSCRSGKNWYDNFSNEYLSKQSLNEPAGKSYLQQGFVSISHFHEENCIFVQNREQFTEKLVTDVSE